MLIHTPLCKEKLNVSVISLLSLSLTFTIAHADSNKLRWDGNKHFYQRFERNYSYDQAKTHCENLSAHLATITSEQENIFIANTVLAGATHGKYYFIGGSDANTEGVWQWITDEAWDYNNWYSGQPSNRDNEDYLLIEVDNTGSSIHGHWFDSSSLSSSTVVGFVCEWSENAYVGSAIVPDINNNGGHEIAALYVDFRTGKHVVKIKDSISKEVISVLDFATNFRAPAGVVSIADMNGNGIPEIAVLYTDTQNNVPKIMIKDAANNKKTLKNFSVLGPNFTPKSITRAPDLNNNGTDELSILGIDNSSSGARVETRDSQSDLIERIIY